jgi:hypothetical protein
MHGGDAYGYGGGASSSSYMNHSSVSSRNDGTTMPHPPPQHHPAYLSALSPAGSEYDPNVATRPNDSGAAAGGGGASSALYLSFLSVNYGGGSTEPATQYHMSQEPRGRSPPRGNLESVFATHRFSATNALYAPRNRETHASFGLSVPNHSNTTFAALSDDLFLSQQQVLLRSTMCSPLSFDIASYAPSAAAPSIPQFGGGGGGFADLSSSAVKDPLAGPNCCEAPAILQHEPWMDEIQLQVSAISLAPLSGYEIVTRLRERFQDILYKYIPCVNFLVQCQQDLRKGLEYVTAAQKQFGGRHKPRADAKQFFANYIEPLARNFYNDNQHRIDAAALQSAMEGLLQLQNDAIKVERAGCEAIKSSYLGGMKDGESWGLRKWLSRHGGALQVCTDLECIWSAVQQQLERTAAPTRQLAALLRPLAQQVLQRLQKEIPPSYQQHSAAHPYLPFFHRLESALRGLSQFDPDKEDDVICVDDSDDDDVVVEVVVRPTHPKKKRARVQKDTAAETSDLTRDDWAGPPAAAVAAKTTTPGKRARRKRDLTQRLLRMTNGGNDDDDDDANSSSGESEVESIVEIVDIMGETDVGGVDGINHDWTCPACSMINVSGETTCLACGEESLFKDLLNFSRLDEFFDGPRGNGSSFDEYGGVGSSSDSTSASKSPLWPVPLEQPELLQTAALVIASNLEKMALMFDRNQQSSIRSLRLPEGSFWDGDHYASALRLFAQILRSPESFPFLECVDDDRLIQAGNSPLFSHVIKHPLSLRLIARAILGDELQSTQNSVDGFLSVRGLNNWNMWFGKDLLQAIDLVFLNSLAYGNALNQGKSQYRSSTNQLRKKFWNGITGIVEGADSERRKQCMPTRRAEKSGFVVYKIGESGG